VNSTGPDNQGEAGDRQGDPIDVRSRLAKGSAWIAGARLTVNALALVSTLLLARLLAPEDFGLVAIATSILAIVSAATELSLGQALVQHRSPTMDHFHAVWTLQAGRSLLLAIGFAIASVPTAAAFGEPRLTGLMLALSIGIFVQGLGNPRWVMMTRDLVFWQQFMMQVGAKVVGLIVSISVAFLYRSYWALVWGSVAAQLTTVLLSYTVLPFLPRPRLKGARELFHFSVWLTLGQVINTVNWRADQLFIGGYLGRTALGYYTEGDNLSSMPTREVTSPLTQTLFPAFARIADAKHHLSQVYQKAQALVTAVALPAGVGTALIAHPLVLLVLGAKWQPAVMVIQILASVFAFQTLGSLSQPLAMASGHTKLLFWRDLQGFVIRLPTITIGMLLGGLPGVLYARALTGSIAIVLHMNVVRQVTGLSFVDQLRVNLRAITAVAAMAGAVSFIDAVATPAGVSKLALVERLAILMGAGALTYVGVTALLWRLAGRPEGPETELLTMARKALGAVGRVRLA
jgi:PST family polysaccharide transporter